MKSRLYNIWNSIKQKCYNPNNSDYCYYGEKGIQVCKEWTDYNSFKQWSEINGYNNTKFLSRKNVDKDYCIENCEWISEYEHKSKRGTTKIPIYIEYNNMKITISELSLLTGIHKNTLRSRYQVGKRGNDLIKGCKVYDIAI